MSATDPAPATPALVFLHIPKTAGTTLMRIAYRQYTPEEIFPMDGLFWPSEEAWTRLRARTPRQRLFFGHMAYGLADALPIWTGYATFLRDPVEVVMSHYYYARRTPDHEHHALLTEGGMSLHDYLASDLVPAFDNGQTRFVAGEPHLPVGAVTDHLLDVAFEHLRGMRAVGVTERFDESLLFLAHAFGWKEPYYVKRNVTKRRPSRETLDPRTLDLILERNRLDERLWRTAAGWADDFIAERGARFQRRLRRFHVRNATVGRGVELAQRLRRRDLPTL